MRKVIAEAIGAAPTQRKIKRPGRPKGSKNGGDPLAHCGGFERVRLTLSREDVFASSGSGAESLSLGRQRTARKSGHY